MSRGETVQRRAMDTSPSISEYVGALISDERRLTLVQIDPSSPWDAFRRMRRILRRMPDARPTISFYESDKPVQHEARVIELDPRRRAG